MSLSEEKKSEVFEEQLLTLWRTGYVTSEELHRLRRVNKQYVEDRLTVHEPVETEPVQQESVEEKPKKEPKPKKEKKVKTAAQVRERNITWTLILGVALLLITGLVVATSQWEQMGAGLKVFSISFVSLFFLALSYGTGRFLKIHQTAFAFLTLGSLLIPIVIVAIGYFELFGSYLSLFGEGRHVLGLMGTLLPLPLYVRHAVKHQSRFYVWVSLLFASLSIGFALGALPLSTDAFYLGLMLYNAALLVMYVRYQNRFKLFMKEIPLYAQLNLILSTLLMLFFYESEVFYSFNLLLTASLYMAMVFVYKTKEYQFVFSVILVYAIYQLVEHSPLGSLDFAVYASAGLLYLGFAYAFRHHSFVEKVFRYTSAFVSLCAFLYISVESILLRGEVGSWLLLFAYVIIMTNYLVLSNIVRQKVFPYLTTLFYFVSLWQLWELVEVGPLVLFFFYGAVASFIAVGLLSKTKWLQPVKSSAFYLSMVAMLGTLTYALNEFQYVNSAMMLLTISILAYVVKKVSMQQEIVKPATWLHPVALSLASMIVYEPLADRWEWIGFSVHIAVTGIVLLLIHLAWRKAGEQELSKASFYIGQSTYIYAMSTLLLNNPDGAFSRPLLLLIGLGLMYWLVHYSKQTPLWLFVSVVTLSFYFSLLDFFEQISFSGFTIYATFAPVLLLVLGEVGKRKWLGMKPYFYWLGHSIQPLVLGLIYLNQTASDNVHPVLWLVPIAVYGFSAWQSEAEWQKKMMLYFSFSTGLLFLASIARYYEWLEDSRFAYSFLATSVAMSILWLFVTNAWKKRIEWYLIPFSILGLFFVIETGAALTKVELVPVLGYVGLNLFFIHQRKWSVVAFAPLLLTIDVWESVEWNQMTNIGIVVVCAAVLLVLGRLFHRYMITSAYRVDAYSWTVLAYIVYLYTLTAVHLNVWIRVLPLVLLAVWLIVCAKKWRRPYVKESFYTGSALSGYVAYIMVLREYATYIPDLIQAELQALPVLVILVFLRKIIWKSFASVLNHIQFAVLLLLAAYLVVDAIQSHTIWDAWIIGGLSLISMIVGLQRKIKSYFFVGMGVLIFNVLYQTRPYWGNMPWWVYLLVAGLVLIGVASYNEWQKQRSDTDKPVERKLKKLWLNLKSWN
ncbi:hypothetical protein [Halobacillus salinus]|uniref:DUF2157 domain-containing protein n=1 Tax=Halobacillus salinus TaxID=192814 RepID=A0A4Z0GW36_9BACI|nr:hypothetical protein [Halobacillus salinus]TGB01965.1 hypothetical protein E4663_15145 [Halobacillus salinus]